MFNLATDTFSYLGTDDYPRLTNKGASIALRPIFSKLYNKAFAGATYKSGVTNSIEAAQFLAGKGVEEKLQSDERPSGRSVAITFTADGALGKDMALIKKLPKHSCDTSIKVNLKQIAPADGLLYHPSPIFRYGEDTYVALFS